MKIREGIEGERMAGEIKGEMGINKRESLFPLGTTQTVRPFCVYLLAMRLSLTYVNLLNL